MIQNVRSIVVVAKLVALFLLYQFLFMMLGQLSGFFYYRFAVEPLSYDAFELLQSSQAVACKSGGMAVGMMLSSLAMIAHLFFFGYVRPTKDFFARVRGDILFLSILFVGCLMIVFNIVAAWLGLENKMEYEVGLLLGNVPGVLTVAVLAPVLEELLFRGAIQGLLMRFFKNPWAGIVVAAVVFGIVHLNPIQVFYATCLGVGLGWLCYRTGSLLPAIVGHIINNSLAVVVEKLFGADVAGAGVSAGSLAEPVAVLLFSFAGAVLASLINKRCSSL